MFFIWKNRNEDSSSAPLLVAIPLTHSALGWLHLSSSRTSSPLCSLGSAPPHAGLTRVRRDMEAGLLLYSGPDVWGQARRSQLKENSLRFPQPSTPPPPCKVWKMEKVFLEGKSLPAPRVSAANPQRVTQRERAAGLGWQRCRVAPGCPLAKGHF